MIEELWETILDNIIDAIVVINRSGDIIYANSAMVQLSGYTRRDILSFNTFRLFGDCVTNTHIFSRVVEQKKTVTMCQRFLKKDHRFSTNMLVTHKPVFDESGDVKYSVVSMKDVKSIVHTFNAVKKSDYDVFHVASPAPVQQFVYESRQMEKLIKDVNCVVSSDAAILVCGESGVGKEVLMEYIHSASKRKSKKLVIINCAALPENLLEAELFGYEKGSFTGAQMTGKEGLIEAADCGTLFLDEIDSLPLSLQGKLLRVIETKQVRRVGGVKSKLVDFRLITATNANLQSCVDTQKFRLDLFYRISVLTFKIPPLRERKEDIRPLCDEFLERYCKKYDRHKTFTENLYQRLLEYSWPGNIRELKNFIERVVLMTDASIEQIDDVASELLCNTDIYISSFETPIVEQRQTKNLVYDPQKSLKKTVSEFERQVITQAIEYNGSLTKAAKALKIDKSTLIRKKR